MRRGLRLPTSLILPLAISGSYILSSIARTTPWIVLPPPATVVSPTDQKNGIDEQAELASTYDMDMPTSTYVYKKTTVMMPQTETANVSDKSGHSRLVHNNDPETTIRNNTSLRPSTTVSSLMTKNNTSSSTMTTTRDHHRRSKYRIATMMTNNERTDHVQSIMGTAAKHNNNKTTVGAVHVHQNDTIATDDARVHVVNDRHNETLLAARANDVDMANVNVTLSNVRTGSNVSKAVTTTARRTTPLVKVASQSKQQAQARVSNKTIQQQSMTTTIKEVTESKQAQGRLPNKATRLAIERLKNKISSRTTTTTTTTQLEEKNSTTQLNKTNDVVTTYHHRPPLSSLIRGKREVIGNVQFLLDFAIVGFPKTATTSMASWIGLHPDTRIPNHEAQALAEGRPGSLVQRLYKMMSPTQQGGDNYKRGYKCPFDITNQGGALESIRQYWPKTKLIVGVRHPIKWFESYYNFRLKRNGIMPDPYALIDKLCPKLFCVKTANFHIFLATLGKTNNSGITSDALGVNYTLPLSPPTVPNKVFLYDMEQMADRNTTRTIQFGHDIQTYLGLQSKMPPIVNMNEGKATPTIEGYLNICNSKYDGLRTELMKASRRASTWIRQYFLNGRNVYVSSREYLEEILITWMDDPCQVNSTTSITE